MLTRKNDEPLDFDFAKVVEQSKDNPVFYVQYAHARACSVLRQAESFAGDRREKARSASLDRPAELALINDGRLAATRRGRGRGARAAPDRLLSL